MVEEEVVHFPQILADRHLRALVAYCVRVRPSRVLGASIYRTLAAGKPLAREEAVVLYAGRASRRRS